ncbi:radical SAM protein [Patescibacteria group bacterium]|nr:radical SAM protein [Patescibacteria group bacterium]
MDFTILKHLNAKISEIAYKFNWKLVPAYPEGVMVEPASVCNLKCVLCPISKEGAISRKNKFIKLKQFKKTFRIARLFIKYITFWNYGEPLLNKDLSQMINFVARFGVNTQVSTNGLVFDHDNIEKILKSGLSKLIISVDTYDSREYAKYRRGGNFDLLERNIKKILYIKSRVKTNTSIALQFIISRHNQEEVNKIKSFFKKFNADELIIKTIGVGSAFIRPSDQELYFLPTNNFLRYNPKTLTVKDKSNLRCKYVWKRMVICSDGAILPCCRDQVGKFTLGNAFRGSLLMQFNTYKYLKFRKEILDIQKNEIMCLRCSEDIKKKIEPGSVCLSQSQYNKNFDFKLK